MRLKLISVLLVLACIICSAQQVTPRQPVARDGHISLNGNWEFLVDADRRFTAEQLPSSGWRVIQVPVSIQAQFPDLRDFKGTGWYRRTFDAPSLKPGEHLLLRFGAVDYLAEIYVNSKPVGQHEGGYTPFALDIAQAIKPGANTLLVRVTDPPPGEDYKQVPHGKQTWYVQTTGIWQDVWLERRRAYYIEQAHAQTGHDLLRGFRVRIADAELIPANAKASIEIVAPDGQSIRREVALKPEPDQTLVFALANARLWAPDDPALYRFTISLPNGDRISDRFGVRTIEARDGRLYLNGKPYYMIGALDQDFYPEGVYSPPSKDYIVREMKLARQLGLNTLRCHIKVPDPRYLEAADETGMLIWYEVPHWDELTEKAKARARRTLEEMIARDWNHPSVVVQTIINESWGIDLSKADQRAWLTEITDFARSSLPNRLVVDNSPCCGNFHLLSDLADYHNYNSIPDSAAGWDKWVAEFAGRPAWLWSNHGDARPTGKEPLIVSEFGNWGLPQLPENLPWWFERGMGTSKGGLTSPAGIFDRFKQYGLEHIFGNYAEFARATQQHEWEQLRHEIESMRVQPAIQGYVITEFTDLNWEANGLLTMWREPKAFQDEITALQQPLVVVATADKPNYREDESARITLTVSNYSAEPLRGATIRVLSSSVALPETGSGQVLSLEPVQIYPPPRERNAPRETESTERELEIDLLDSAGKILSSTYLNLPVIAAVEHGREAVQVAGGESTLMPLVQKLRADGYRVGQNGVLITNKWDEAAQKVTSEGGSVIVLATGENAFTAGAITTVARKDDLGGDWISNFNWFDTTRPPFRDVAVRALAGWETKNIVPRYLLAGVEPARYGDVLSGFFLGWIRQPHATTIAFRHGSGRVIVTTLALAQTYGEDAYATALLDALVKHINSPEFSPTMSF